MTQWPEVQLGDHTDLFTGFPFKSAHFLDNPLEAVRLLRGDNVGQGLLRWDGAKHWSKDACADYAAFELREGDVILAMDRPWIEAGLKYASVRKSDLPCLLVQRVARLRGANGLTTEYLRYVIGSANFTDHVKSITTGVNVPHISGRDIKRFSFHLPPLPLQRRIASILGAYDDLIEVNRRRIAVLEEMARRLFDEWFVNFRFPGHESHEMVETDQGAAPKGWARRRLDTITNINGRTLRPADAPERIKYVDIASVSPGCVDQITDTLFADAPGRARRLVKDGSVIWSMVRPNRRSFAVILDPPENMVVSTGFAVLDAVEIPFTYLYLATTTDAFVGYLTGRATGSAYPAVTGTTFAEAMLLVPPSFLLEAFSRHAEPQIRLATHLREANVRLAASRDLLLPRLISGELSVATAERELEAAA